MVKLGIDASTTTIGWAFFSHEPDSPELLDCGFIDISKLDTSKEKAYCFIDFITHHSLFEKVEILVLEAALSGFQMGRTSQQTIIKLVKWNGIFEYILNEKFPDKDIQLLGVNAIRKAVFGRCRVKGVKPKDLVKMELEERVPNIRDFIVLNTRGNPDVKNSDMYDAVVCSMC
jgi:Holliday junction resolvasome RuvABC endonuclease subunit